MNGGVEFNGLVGVFIFLCTIVVLLAVTVISLAAYIVVGRGDRKQRPVWPKYLFIPAVTFLLLDVSIYISIISGGVVTLTRDEAVALDSKMLFIWIPVHIVCYLLYAAVLYFIDRRRERIDVFINRLR